MDTHGFSLRKHAGPDRRYWRPRDAVPDARTLPDRRRSTSPLTAQESTYRKLGGSYSYRPSVRQSPPVPEPAIHRPDTVIVASAVQHLQRAQIPVWLISASIQLLCRQRLKRHHTRVRRRDTIPTNQSKVHPLPCVVQPCALHTRTLGRVRLPAEMHPTIVLIPIRQERIARKPRRVIATEVGTDWDPIPHH